MNKSTELFINMKDVPEWNRKKHYYEQSRDVLLFWEDMWDKIVNGTNIGGYKMHGWTYFHANFFKTPIPTQMNSGVMEDILKVPDLDDNFLIFSETYAEAEALNKGMLLFGTRGSLKSTALSSNSHWTSLVKDNGVLTITGGDDGDLGDIKRLALLSFDNVHPALHVNILSRSKDIEIGIRLKDQTPIEKNKIKIVNADAGKDKKSEKGAGGSPIGYIMDEIGKYSFLKIFEAARPAFETPYGYRLVPLLAGTSGNTVLSQDAKKMLSNPEAYDMMPMNYDRLERMVRPEDITWEHTKQTQKFATFMPGQMSYRLKSPKKSYTLSEVLGISDENLDKIQIKCTDWKEADKKIQELIDKSADEDAKDKTRMYYPRDLEDVFLTQGTNPFPISACKRRLAELKSSGSVGKPVEIVQNGSKFEMEFSSKRKAPLHYKGGEEDAPIMVYGEFPQDVPTKHINLSGLDHYKLEGPASEGSLGALYVIKRRNLSINSPCETILASYAARPRTHRIFNHTCEKMVRAFNAECNMESVDQSFQAHLKNKNLDADYLCPAFSFAKSSQGNGKALTTLYGLYPTGPNNKVRMDYLFEWAKEEHVVGLDDDNNEIIKLSVEFIDDPDLLEEMIEYRYGGNYDRISAFSHALILSSEYDKKGVKPKENKRADQVKQHMKKTRKKTAAFGRRDAKVF